MELTKEIFKKPELNDFAKLLLKNGFRLLVPLKSSTYFKFEKDGKLGYCQLDTWGFRFSTVHKPAQGIGTGFGLQDYYEGVCAPTVKDAEKALVFAPNWVTVSDCSKVKKYTSLEEYMNEPINRIIDSKIFEPIN